MFALLISPAPGDNKACSFRLLSLTTPASCFGLRFGAALKPHESEIQMLCPIMSSISYPQTEGRGGIPLKREFGGPFSADGLEVAQRGAHRGGIWPDTGWHWYGIPGGIQMLCTGCTCRRIADTSRYTMAAAVWDKLPTGWAINAHGISPSSLKALATS